MKRVLLSLLVWFLTSTPASAGCAWVLWTMPYTVMRMGTSSSMDDTPSYDVLEAGSASVVSAWESKKECEAALTQSIQDVPFRKDKPFRKGGSILVEIANGGLKGFQCLPETVKPTEGGGFLKKAK